MYSFTRSMLSICIIVVIVVAAGRRMAAPPPNHDPPQRARVHIDYTQQSPSASSLKLLAFCIDCPNPNLEGSIGEYCY